MFRDRDARVLVLHALAKSLLGSRAHYQSLLDRIDALRRDAGADRLGHEGQRVPAVSAGAWRSLLPDATVETIEGAGHWPHEEEPARVIAAIERFLK